MKLSVALFIDPATLQDGYTETFLVYDLERVKGIEPS